MGTKQFFAIAAIGTYFAVSNPARAAGEIMLNDAPLFHGSLGAMSVPKVAPVPLPANPPTIYKIKKITTNLPAAGAALVPSAAISSIELEPSHKLGQKQLPVYLFGALGEQKKFDFNYDEDKISETYLLHVVLDAIAQAKGFSDKGLDYVKVKLAYEKTYESGANPKKGLFEITTRYNLEDDNVKAGTFLNKAYKSKTPQNKPFKTGLKVFFNPFLDDEDYLGRNLEVAGINDSDTKLKSITIFAPGVSDQLWLTLLSSFAGEALKAGISGTTAGAAAGAAK